MNMNKPTEVSWGESVVKHDRDFLEARRKTMTKLRWGPLLTSVSRALTLIGGPLFGTSLLVTLGVVPVAGAVSLAAVTTATIVGGAMMLTAIAIDYASSRFYQDAGFDTTDIGAQSYAKSFIRELKQSGIVINTGRTDEYASTEAPQRNDGKTWVQINEEKQPQEAAHRRN